MPAACMADMSCGSVTGERAKRAPAAAAAMTSEGVRTVPAPMQADGNEVERDLIIAEAEGVVRATSTQRMPPRRAAEAAERASVGESKRMQRTTGEEWRRVRVSEMGSRVGGVGEGEGDGSPGRGDGGTGGLFSNMRGMTGTRGVVVVEGVVGVDRWEEDRDRAIGTTKAARIFGRRDEEG